MIATTPWMQVREEGVVETPILATRAFQPKTGKDAYTQAPMMLSADGETASLVFQTTTKPLEAYKKFLDSQQDRDGVFVQDSEKDSNYIVGQVVMLCRHPEAQQTKYQKIRRVLINLPLFNMKNSTCDEALLNKNLVDNIGYGCKNAFPNMRAEESAFNVYAGTHRYQVDAQLLPSTDRHGVVHFHSN